MSKNLTPLDFIKMNNHRMFSTKQINFIPNFGKIDQAFRKYIIEINIIQSSISAGFSTGLYHGTSFPPVECKQAFAHL